MPEPELHPYYWTHTDFVLNKSAQPPFKKFGEITNKNERFAKFWSNLDEKQKNIYDYHIELASLFIYSGWSDQEIVDTLVFSVNEINTDAWDEVKFSDRYFHNVLINARKICAVHNINEILDAIDQKEGDDKSKKRTAILEQISAVFCVNIKRILKYKAGKSVYHIKTDKGEIIIGEVKNLINQTLLRENLADATGVYIPVFKEPRWRRIAQSLLDSCEEVAAGEEATTKGMVEHWLTTYFDEKQPVEDVNEAFAGKYPFVRGENFCIIGSFFRKWLWNFHGEKLTSKQMGVFLRVYGCMPDVVAVQMNGSTTTRNVWTVKRAKFKNIKPGEENGSKTTAD